MPKPTPARQKAIGLIGSGDIGTLEKNGLSIAYTIELARLREELDELRRRVGLLKRIALESLEDETK